VTASRDYYLRRERRRPLASVAGQNRSRLGDDAAGERRRTRRGGCSLGHRVPRGRSQPRPLRRTLTRPDTAQRRQLTATTPEGGGSGGLQLARCGELCGQSLCHTRPTMSGQSSRTTLQCDPQGLWGRSPGKRSRPTRIGSSRPTINISGVVAARGRAARPQRPRPGCRQVRANATPWEGRRRPATARTRRPPAVPTLASPTEVR